MTAFPNNVQNFLKHLAKSNEFRTISRQLITACRVFRMIGKDATNHLIEVLINTGASSFASDPEFVKFAYDYPHLKHIGPEMSILTLYTILSLANSEKCIKENSTH